MVWELFQKLHLEIYVSQFMTLQIIPLRFFLLERWDKPVKGEGGCHFFITLQFNHIYCMWGESKGSKVAFIILAVQSFDLTMQDSDPTFYCSKT